MKVDFLTSIEHISAQQWNTVSGIDYPFLRHEFLAALEQKAPTTNNSSAACSVETGWQPWHMVISEHDTVLAVMPMYIKQHSYGEYIFDWNWAEAYQRNGINYYPKLFTGIPFTPSSGPRIAISPTVKDQTLLLNFLCTTLKQQCIELGTSSFHLLFPEKQISNALHDNGLTQRTSFQYHWYNQNQHGAPYTNFDEFVGSFKARKRKVLNKERQLVSEHNITIKRLQGSQITASIWQTFYQFYQHTYAKRSGHGGYLPQSFFLNIGESLGDKIMLVVAEQDDTVIAAALNFYSSDTLYGRYWGCSQELEFLHFELCYYQGIEFCIEQGLQKFDAGAQGEHKIQRGFKPTKTFSNHWIVEPQFRHAINNFITEEANHNQSYISKASELLPFKALQ